MLQQVFPWAKFLLITSRQCGRQAADSRRLRRTNNPSSSTVAPIYGMISADICRKDAQHLEMGTRRPPGASAVLIDILLHWGC